MAPAVLCTGDEGSRGLCRVHCHSRGCYFQLALFSVDQPLLRSLLRGHDGALRLVHLRADADHRPLHPRLPRPVEVTG